jgi:hypothetical protein
MYFLYRIFACFIPQLHYVKDPLLVRDVLDGVGELIKISEESATNEMLADVTYPTLEYIQNSASQKRPFLLESALHTFSLLVVFDIGFLIFNIGIIIRASGNVVSPLNEHKQLFRSLLNILRCSSSNLFRETLRVLGIVIS